MHKEKVVEWLNAHQKEVEAQITEQAEIADRLLKDDPKLDIISAMVIAGDMQQLERAKEMIRDGISFDDAFSLTGSFGRMDLILWALDEHHLTLDHALDLLPRHWSGADPNDTNMRFWKLWREAYVRNHGNIIYDNPDKTLPDKKEFIVFRGQDEDGPPGISWTLNEKVAERFANGAATRQWGRKGIVYRAVAPRIAVYAYLTNRDEEEIIINPFMLKDAV